MERRKKKSGIGMWIIMGIMVVAMGGFGLSSVFSGSASTAAMVVGDIEVSANDFNRAYQSRLSQLNGITPADARMIGVPEMVMQSEYQVAALRDVVVKGEFEFSDQEIATEIAKIPAFQDSNGKFDAQKYEQILDQNNLSERNLIASIRGDLQRNLAVNLISELTPDLPELVAMANAVQGEARAANYIEIDFSSTGVTLETPSDDELRSFYDAEPDNYMAAPLQELEIAYLIPSKIDDARTKEIYDADPEAFAKEGSVKFAVLLPFDTEPEAQAITDLNAFNSAISEKGLNEADIKQENIALGSLPDFGKPVEKDGLYGPVETPFGFAIYNLQGVTPAQNMSFDEAKAEIAQSLAFDELQEKLAGANEKTQDLIAGGAKPSTISSETSYELATIQSTETLSGVSDDPAFQSAIKVLEIDTTSAPIDLANGGIAFVSIIKEDAPQKRPFDEVKEQVETDLTSMKQADALSEFTEKLMAELNEGRTIEAVAEANNLTLERTSAVPFAEAQTSMPLPIAMELFNRNDGETWQSETPDNFIIAEVAEVVAFDPNAEGAGEMMSQNQTAILDLLSNSILSNYANAHGQAVDSTFNQSIINQITGASQ